MQVLGFKRLRQTNNTSRTNQALPTKTDKTINQPSFKIQTVKYYSIDVDKILNVFENCKENSGSPSPAQKHGILDVGVLILSTCTFVFNLLKPTGHVMHQQFNIQQLYLLPTLHLCVLYLSENKQRLVPLAA